MRANPRREAARLQMVWSGALVTAARSILTVASAVEVAQIFPQGVEGEATREGLCVRTGMGRRRSAVAAARTTRGPTKSW